MYSRYYSITSTSKNDTCCWLFNCEEYQHWRDDGGLLWIKGKPVSGKSTLMRWAFDERKKNPDNRNESTNDHEQSTDNLKGNVGDQKKSTDSKNPELKKSIILSFFFHGRGSSLQKTMLGFYRTVLFQLLEEQSIREEKIEALSNLEKFFKTQCDSRGPPGISWQWEMSQLAQDFQSALTEILKGHLVYLYVDALDECGEDDARHLTETFVKMIKESPIKRIEESVEKPTDKMVQKKVGKRLYICCSCRNPPLLINAMVEDTFQVCVERHNITGIDSYVWSQLDPFRDTRIPNTIINYSAGSFMWAYLVLERVKSLYSRGFSKKEIEGSIAETPRDLERLYEDLFQNMLGNKNSLRLVYWICFAKEPLTLEELRWAMFIDANPTIKSLKDCKSARDFPCDCECLDKCTCKVMERRVEALGHGLVEITDSNDVQFIHQFVQEFFIDKMALVRLYNRTSNSRPKDFDQVAREAQQSMAETCVRYCNMEELVAASGINTPGSKASLSTAGDRLKKEFPFLNYAVTSWVNNKEETGSHVANVSSQREYDVLNLLASAFPEINQRRTGNTWIPFNVRKVIAKRNP
ncbi:hypothetical protein TMatcc_001016 [Talaromyces marneffei ATCC 18224]